MIAAKIWNKGISQSFQAIGQFRHTARWINACIKRRSKNFASFLDKNLCVSHLGYFPLAADHSAAMPILYTRSVSRVNEKIEGVNHFPDAGEMVFRPQIAQNTSQIIARQLPRLSKKELIIQSW